MVTHSQPGAKAGIPCFHCGAMCDEGAVEYTGRNFCCVGCSLVYQLLRTDSVCDVVQEERVASQRFSRKPIPRFEFLDDQTVEASLISFKDARVSQCQFIVPSIHCASCIWTLENLFRLDPSIVRSEVNFLKKTVNIGFLHHDISLRQVVELITRLGYEPEIRMGTQANARPINKSIRSLYYKIGVAGFAFGNVMLFSAPDYLAKISSDGAVVGTTFARLFAMLSIALSVPVLLYSASDYFINSWMALRERRLSLDVPIAIGVSALFVRSLIEILGGTGTGYLDSFTGLVFFLLIARLFQAKSFETLSFERDYTSYFPLSVVVREHAHQRVIPIAKLEEGMVIVIRNNEIIPADAVVISDHVHVDYSFVSGESDVVELLRGATVFAGGRVIGSAVECTVTKSVSHSYLTQLWNNSAFAKEKKSAFIDLSDAFAKYFTLVTIALAALTFAIWLPNLTMALSTFTAVLIVACPCALTLAAPFTFGAAMTILGKARMYIRHIGVVADMASVDTIVFDKTGTLTHSTHASVRFSGSELSEEERRIIAVVAQQSSHPLSAQIVDVLAGADFDRCAIQPEWFDEYPGSGVESRIEGHHVLLGSADLVCAGQQGSVGQSQTPQVHVAIDGRYRGVFQVELSLREGMRETIAALSSRYKLYLLSGDSDKQRDEFSQLFDNDHLLFRQSPDEKMLVIKSLQERGHRVAMIGDGMNDAGALRQSNVGIAVSENSTSFTPACDIIVSASALYRLADFFAFAHTSLRVLRIAFLVSVVYNIIGLALACGGQLTPMFAALFMPLSSWSVVGIAYGLMRLQERALVLPITDRRHSAIVQENRGVQASLSSTIQG